MEFWENRPFHDFFFPKQLNLNFWKEGNYPKKFPLAKLRFFWNVEKIKFFVFSGKANQNFKEFTKIQHWNKNNHTHNFYIRIAESCKSQVQQSRIISGVKEAFIKLPGL